MPFAKRIVSEALWIENRGVKLDGSSCPANNLINGIGICGDDGEPTAEASCRGIFESGASNFIQQLDCLVRIADDLFSELYVECNSIVRRAGKIKERVEALTDVVQRLNAKDVRVPESDLVSTARSGDHYGSCYGYDCQLFTPASRPECIEQLYNLADGSPVHAIRQCNLYRIDGKTGSRIFSMPPAFTSSESVASFEIFQPVRPTLSRRSTKQLREPKCTQDRDPSRTTRLESRGCLLPNPDDRIRRLSQSQPVLVVSVNVSGQNFQRLSERRSRSRSTCEIAARTVKTRTAKTRRRKGAFSSFDRINEDFGFGLRACHELWKRSPSRERWERVWCAFQEKEEKLKIKKLKPKVVKERNKSKKQEESNYCLWGKSLCSLLKPSKDGFGESLWIEGQSETDKTADVEESSYFSRSQSLPRSFKMAVQQTPRKVASAQSLSVDSNPGDIPTISDLPEPSSIPRRSSMRIRRPARRIERNSSTSSRNFGRVESPDHTAAEPLLRENSLELPPNAKVVSAQRVSETAAADGCREVVVHLPDQPWTRPFATVKLRPQSAKFDFDNCQTSSGHWSTDSACHSMLSDHISVLPPGDRRLRRSLDKDSAICDLNQCDSGSLENTHSKSSTTVLESSTAITSESSSQLSLSVPSVVSYRSKPRISVAAKSVEEEPWDVGDATSLFSVDQDGFYTSMHADSGLSKSGARSKSCSTLTSSDDRSNCTDSVSSKDLKGLKREDSSVTVVFKDWIPTRPDDLSRERRNVPDVPSKEAMKDDVRENQIEALLSCDPSRSLPSSISDDFRLVKPECVKEEGNGGSSYFPSFCNVTSCSSDADDGSSRGTSEEPLIETCVSSGNPQAINANCETGSLLSYNEKQLNGQTVQETMATAEIQQEDDSNDVSTSQMILSSVVKSILKSTKLSDEEREKDTGISPITCLQEDLNDENCYERYANTFTTHSVVDNDTCKTPIRTDVKSKYGIASDVKINEKHSAPSKCDSVDTVKPKKRRSCSTSRAVRRKDAGVTVATGCGHLGGDAIAACMNIHPPSEHLTVNLTPASAKLVITSPVKGHAKYVENPYKRLHCTSVTQQDFVDYASYSNPKCWHNTTPRKPSMTKTPPKGHSFSLKSGTLLTPGASTSPIQVNTPGCGITCHVPLSGGALSSAPNSIFATLPKLRRSVQFEAGLLQPLEFGADRKTNSDVTFSEVMSNPKLIDTMEPEQSLHTGFSSLSIARSRPLFNSSPKCSNTALQSLNVNSNSQTTNCTDLRNSLVCSSESAWSDECQNNFKSNSDSFSGVCSWETVLKGDDSVPKELTENCVNDKAVAAVVRSSSFENSPDLVPSVDRDNVSVTVAKSLESISSILSASESVTAEKYDRRIDIGIPFSADRSSCINRKLQVGSNEGNSPLAFPASNKSQNTVSRQKSFTAGSKLSNLGSTTAWKAYSPKQDLGSDLGEFRSSVYPNPVMSPDADVSIHYSLKRSPKRAAKADSCHSSSPDVIPMIARTCRTTSFGSNDRRCTKGVNVCSTLKQTSV